MSSAAVVVSALRINIKYSKISVSLSFLNKIIF